MEKIRYAVVMALGLVLSVGCTAETVDESSAVGSLNESLAVSPATDKTTIVAKVKSIVGVEPDTIANAPLDGILEITAANQVFYMSEDANYMLFGHIYDLSSGMKDLTEVALGKVRLDAIAPFQDDAIEFKADDEQHVITVFTDYTCGYCKKLHREVAELNDAGITVRYLAWPRAGLGTENYENMVSIWCAADPKSALTRAKTISNPTFGGDNCKNTVAEQFTAGRDLGVRGTPAIIFDNGKMVPGYKPAKVLIQDIFESE